MGLPNWLHWTAWFTQTLIMFFVSVILIVILLKTPLVGNDLYVLPYSDWSCILAFLFVYIIASITFCFAISVFFSKGKRRRLYLSRENAETTSFCFFFSSKHGSRRFRHDMVHLLSALFLSSRKIHDHEFGYEAGCQSIV